MFHDDEELKDDDFDLEFSDLPIEGEPTFVEKIVLRVIALFSNRSGWFDALRTRLPVSLARIRGWLLAKPERQHFADGSSSADIELELSDLPDLPPTRLDGVARAVSGLSYKARLWRITIAVCTIILTLALILSAVPQARGLLFHATPTPTPVISSSPSQSYTRSSIILVPSEGTPDVVAPGTTVAGWQVGALPAPAPSSCPARPNLRGSSGYGRQPVWAVGFDGGPATLHFAPPAPVPDMIFPTGFAWTTSLNIEVQASYTQPISLTGQNLDDGTLIYFDYNPSQGAQSSFITLNAPQTPAASSSMPNGSILLWSINLYLSSASCYSLQAHWATGSWTMNFSAGR